MSVKKSIGIFAIVCMFLSGCGDGNSNPKTYKVSGVVTKGSKPIDGANVMFVTLEPEGQSAVGITNSEGKYELTTFESNDGALPGQYIIKVTQYVGGAVPSSSESDRFMTLEEQNAQYNPDEKQDSGPKNMLPAKYANEVTSGLKHTVSTEPTNFNIEIK